jgi:hypothetical protein
MLGENAAQYCIFLGDKSSDLLILIPTTHLKQLVGLMLELHMRMLP